MIVSSGCMVLARRSDVVSEDFVERDRSKRGDCEPMSFSESVDRVRMRSVSRDVLRDLRIVASLFGVELALGVLPLLALVSSSSLV